MIESVKPRQPTSGHDITKFSFVGPARIHSIVECIEITEPALLPAITDVGAPSSDAAIPTDPDHPTGVASADLSISAVSRARDISKVGEPIIRSVAIDVVDLVGPFPVNVHPNHSVSINLMPENTTRMVSDAVNRGECTFVGKHLIPRSRAILSTTLAGPKKVRGPLSPKEQTRIGFVAQDVAQQLLGKYHLFSHGAAPSRGGQGRAVLPTLFRPANDNSGSFKERKAA